MTRHRLLSRYDSGLLRLAVMLQTTLYLPESICDCAVQEGELVTLLEADRVPAGMPPPPAYQVLQQWTNKLKLLNIAHYFNS